ncbi:MAG TPA: hypothetical protein VHL31_19710 [Geminicoccus sp.]|uniref:hypothetical protein n=1 Tax=Geminicoccus sp. TaxID=2024832 RepID=UPI002E300CE3|nr:hypothetical protein [Geminicoccus sp.]HEX2528511.1 hypothetical protein [Geminicoccus sp.]
MAAAIALGGCSFGMAPTTPIEQQPGQLRSTADQPARRASQMIGALKLGDEQLLQACLQRYESESTPGQSWRLADPKLVAMKAVADQALDHDTRVANPDGWVDRGDMRSAIVPVDGDIDEARCLVCSYDMDDGAAEPLRLFGVETVDNCT